ncbi:hypothetical protein MTBLM1_10279 [Rhodospirillaceae bacterium LM-1]|nr:hypothetical protein MTBLM1_10279 [Rhodospirillaceae bacterium LM-1]
MPNLKGLQYQAPIAPFVGRAYFQDHSDSGETWFRQFSMAPCDSQPYRDNREPSLEEVLADPVIHHLMECDGVKMTSLLMLIGETQRRIR